MKNGDQESVVSLNAEILKDVFVQVDVVDHKVPNDMLIPILLISGYFRLK